MQIKKYINENPFFYGAISMIIIANMLISFVVINSKVHAIQSLKQEYSKLRGDRTGLSDKLKNQLKQETMLTSINEDVDSFLKLLPDGIDLTTIIAEFHKLSRKTGLRIEAAKYSTPKVEALGLIKYNISFPLEGRYRQIRQFIYGLEKMPYLMSIEDLSISSNKYQSVSLTLNINLYLKATGA